MIFAIVVAAFFALMILSDLFGQSGTKSIDSEHKKYDSSVNHYHPPTHMYQDPYYSRGPIFSPSKRDVWDGHKWVPVESGFSFGLILGALLALVIIYIL